MVRIVSIVALAALAFSAPAWARWPDSMEVGGFRITGITGTENPDGSGRGTGRLMIPGDGSCPIDLTRSASGVVTGSTRSALTLGGIRIDGSFVLDRQGLQGAGTVLTGGRSIMDANLSFDARRGIAGRGRVYLGSGFTVVVQLQIGQQKLTVTGSAARQVSVDTPLAVYTFKGDVEVSAAGTALKTTAKGTIVRKGKVGGAASRFGPMAFDVNAATGEARLNVGGADIVIDLW